MSASPTANSAKDPLEDLTVQLTLAETQIARGDKNPIVGHTAFKTLEQIYEDLYLSSKFKKAPHLLSRLPQDVKNRILAVYAAIDQTARLWIPRYKAFQSSFDGDQERDKASASTGPAFQPKLLKPLPLSRPPGKDEIFFNELTTYRDRAILSLATLAANVGELDKAAQTRKIQNSRFLFRRELRQYILNYALTYVTTLQIYDRQSGYYEAIELFKSIFGSSNLDWPSADGEEITLLGRFRSLLAEKLALRDDQTITVDFFLAKGDESAAWLKTARPKILAFFVDQSLRLNRFDQAKSLLWDLARLPDGPEARKARIWSATIFMKKLVDQNDLSQAKRYADFLDQWPKPKEVALVKAWALQPYALRLSHSGQRDEVFSLFTELLLALTAKSPEPGDLKKEAHLTVALGWLAFNCLTAFLATDQLNAAMELYGLWPRDLESPAVKDAHALIAGPLIAKLAELKKLEEAVTIFRELPDSQSEAVNEIRGLAVLAIKRDQKAYKSAEPIVFTDLKDKKTGNRYWANTLTRWLKEASAHQSLVAFKGKRLRGT
jgi:hypothetical protein